MVKFNNVDPDKLWNELVGISKVEQITPSILSNILLWVNNVYVGDPIDSRVLSKINVELDNRITGFSKYGEIKFSPNGLILNWKK